MDLRSVILCRISFLPITQINTFAHKNQFTTQLDIYLVGKFGLQQIKEN